jgi:hypothetical protein
VLCAKLTVTLLNAYHGLLLELFALRAVLSVHITGFTADIGLIDLDRAIQLIVIAI